MNTAVRIASIAATSLMTVAGVATAYFFSAFPKVEAAPDFAAEPTPELLERGRYLAENVAVCVDCHSERDWSRFSAPVKPGSFGKGGEKWGREVGVPGVVHSSNITPAGVGHWTNGELATAITEGVNRDGSALFPLMPYRDYAHLCDRDVKAIVSYLRTLSPIDNEIPEREIDFPLNLIIRTLPSAPSPWRCSDETEGLERGRYLTTIAGCAHCHSPSEQGEPIAGKEFSGGVPMPTPGGVVRTANITFDEETGIGRWTREQFIARFRSYGSPGAATPVGEGDLNTFMPWTMYGRMTEGDLGAIYDYLRTQKAVKNPMVRFEPKESK